MPGLPERDPDAPEYARAGAAHTPRRLPDQAEVETLFRLLVESVADYAIFVLDPEGYILTWNPGAQRFKGYQAHEIIGKHFSVFYPESDIAAGKPAYELVVASREGRFEDEDWRLRRDGTRFWANVVITALRDESGELVGFAKVTRDLTERRASEQRAIEDARRLAEVESANRAKSEFLAIMSHELRTPLNAIGGYVDLLILGVRGALNEKQLQDLERIRRSQKHLLAIINDLLNFSRLEADQVAYEIAPARVQSMVHDVVAMMEMQATAGGIQLSWAACEDAVVVVDRAKVEQILLNLLSNAVKFTPQGGSITITCETASERDVVLTVSDTGIGIPPEKLESVFEPFVQLGRSLSSAHEGTGLGLAISRDLARAMGGELSARSTPGAGSTFLLTLPRLPAD